jgi:hypothetical protein
MGERPLLSVCIPYYGKSADVVEQAIESAHASLPDRSELLVFPDGEEAAKELGLISLPSGVRVLPSTTRLGLVANWNRCLGLSAGQLVHLLHDDDVVAPGFFRAILELRARFSQAALYATGVVELNEDESETAARSKQPQEPFYVEGAEAARFILEDARYSAGSVVLSRRAIDSAGLFRAEFPYCPDEEALLRYAREGGIAFDSARLYRVRTHERQTRFSTWRRPDFVATYVRSRIEGAAGFGPSVVELASDSSARRVISVAVSLALNGEADLAARRLDELADVLPRCRRWPRFWLARAAAHSAFWRRAAELRRRRVVRARTLLGSEVRERDADLGQTARETPHTD